MFESSQPLNMTETRIIFPLSDVNTKPWDQERRGHGVGGGGGHTGVKKQLSSCDGKVVMVMGLQHM